MRLCDLSPLTGGAAWCERKRKGHFPRAVSNGVDDHSAAVKTWLHKFIIGKNFCPWAKSVSDNDSVRAARRKCHVFGSVLDDAWWFPQTVQVTSRKLLRSWVLLSTPLSNCRISLCAGSESQWLSLSLALRPQKMEYCAIWKKKSLHSHPVQMCPRVFLALLCWCALTFRPGKSEAYSSSSWTVCWRLLQEIVGNRCMPSISSLWGFWYFQRVLWKCSSEWCPFWGEFQSEVGSLSPKLHPLTFASHAALIRF